jgi:hypothetical protein
MPKANKKACRGRGRQGDTVAGVPCVDCSAALRERLRQIEPWVPSLQPIHLGVLLVLILRQPRDGAALQMRHSEIASCFRQGRWASVRAVKELRALGLLDVAVQGDAKNASHYRVPNPLPAAPELPAKRARNGGAR